MQSMLEVHVRLKRDQMKYVNYLSHSALNQRAKSQSPDRYVFEEDHTFMYTIYSNTKTVGSP